MVMNYVIITELLDSVYNTMGTIFTILEMLKLQNYFPGREHSQVETSILERQY
jgi:hypothetical protein